MSYSEKHIKDLRQNGESQTDWDRVRSLTDKEVKNAIAQDADAALSPRPEDWNDLMVSITPPKEPLYMRVDADVLAWYRSQGRGYQTMMNAVLRSYHEAHKDDPAIRP